MKGRDTVGMNVALAPPLVKGHPWEGRPAASTSPWQQELLEATGLPRENQAYLVFFWISFIDFIRPVATMPQSQSCVARSKGGVRYNFVCFFMSPRAFSFDKAVRGCRSLFLLRTPECPLCFPASLILLSSSCAGLFSPRFSSETGSVITLQGDFCMPFNLLSLLAVCLKQSFLLSSSFSSLLSCQLSSVLLPRRRFVNTSHVRRSNSSQEDPQLAFQ